MNRRQMKGAARALGALAEKLEEREEAATSAMGEAVAASGASGTIEADDSPVCTQGQRVQVKNLLKQAMSRGIVTGADVPDDITIGQAVAIFETLGSDPAKLFSWATGNPTNKQKQWWEARS